MWPAGVFVKRAAFYGAAPLGNPPFLHVSSSGSESSTSYAFDIIRTVFLPDGGDLFSLFFPNMQEGLKAMERDNRAPSSPGNGRPLEFFTFEALIN